MEKTLKERLADKAAGQVASNPYYGKDEEDFLKVYGWFIKNLPEILERAVEIAPSAVIDLEKYFMGVKMKDLFLHPETIQFYKKEGLLISVSASNTVNIYDDGCGRYLTIDFGSGLESKMWPNMDIDGLMYDLYERIALKGDNDGDESVQIKEIDTHKKSLSDCDEWIIEDQYMGQKFFVVKTKTIDEATSDGRLANEIMKSLLDITKNTSKKNDG